MENVTTAYGARVGTPAEAAAVLRALASRAGLELRPASAVDLAAAVIAADVWSRVCRVTDLSMARTAGRAASGAAGAVLARAAGYGDDGHQEALVATSGCDTVLGMLEQYRGWAAAALGADGMRAALWRAGSDLVCDDERLVGAALALQLASDEQ